MLKKRNLSPLVIVIEAKQILGQMIKALGDLLLTQRSLVLVQAWRESCGPALLKHVAFGGIINDGRRRLLVLEVSDPIWRQELEYQKDSIVEAYSKTLRTYGFHDSELPNECSLRMKASMPNGSLYAQKARNKERIKR